MAHINKRKKEVPKEEKGWFKRKRLGTITQTSEDKKILNEFFEGVRSGDLEKVKEALKAGADVNARDPMTYRTAVIWAVMRKDTEMLRLLADNKADVNLASISGTPPLIYAVAAKSLEIAEILLENGADVNAKDSSGKTALEHAKSDSNTEMVELLKKYGAKK